MIIIDHHPCSNRLRGTVKMKRLVSERYRYRIQSGTMPIEIVVDLGPNKYDNLKLTIRPSVAVNPPAIAYFGGVRMNFQPRRDEDRRLEQILYDVEETLKPCTIRKERRLVKKQVTLMFARLCRADHKENRDKYVA